LIVGAHGSCILRGATHEPQPMWNRRAPIHLSEKRGQLRQTGRLMVISTICPCTRLFGLIPACQVFAASVRYFYEAPACICAAYRWPGSPHVRSALRISRRVLGPLCPSVSHGVNRLCSIWVHRRSSLHQQQTYRHGSWFSGKRPRQLQWSADLLRGQPLSKTVPIALPRENWLPFPALDRMGWPWLPGIPGRHHWLR
jgi:hypothetical protein